MEYRVILTKNGEYKKTFHRCKKRKTAFKHYHTIKGGNEVLFPKKFINYNGIKPVEYALYVVKDHEKDDDLRVLRDEYGRLYTEEVLFDKWTALASCPYNLEENFYVYGYNPIHERLDAKEIIDKIVKGSNNAVNLKQIVVVHNKLIIYNENQFDMVICKCKKDAQRLHHLLKKIAKENKYKNLLFFGTAQDIAISQMYDVIYENTDWSMRKIRRTSTRP